MAKVKGKVLSVLYFIKHRLSTSKLWIGMKLGLIRSVMLITDTIEAAYHTVSKGWILEEDIAHIAEEKKEDTFG